ncbi:MFS transporter [Achromobacter sp. SD115]|uniref:MFS transporter n=1 Tax=Achromobacter sp. SD115 TaxID=2782011 RepID=UPI001A9615B4|nr:MFS transporter [Achromobacter sp. SD115]
MAILACTLAIQAVSTAGALAFAVLVPLIPGARTAEVGLFLAVVYGGAMMSSALSSVLVGRLGAVRVSQAALTLQAAGLAVLAIEAPLAQHAAALLCGLGYGIITPASSHILARTTAQERMYTVFSLKQTGVPLGGLLAGAILPALAAWSSWRMALLFLAGAACVVALASDWLRAQLDEPAAPRATGAGQWHRPVMDVLQRAQLRTMAGISLLFSACQLSVSGYLMVFLQRDLQLGVARAVLVYAVAQGAGIVGRVAWGRIADRTRSPRGVLMLIGVLMAGSALGLAFTPVQSSLLVLCLLAAMLGATAIGWNGVFLGELARLAPAGKVASVTGGTMFFTYIGVVIGPPAFGFMAERSSLGVAYGALAVLPLMALFLLGSRSGWRAA